jgi:hypothetical protein
MGDVRRVAEKTRQKKQHRNALKDIIGFEPADEESHIVPASGPSIPRANPDLAEHQTHQIFHDKVNVMMNLNSETPVGSSAVTSPITAMIPTKRRSMNNSNDWTSSAPDARQRMPLWKYCRTTGVLKSFKVVAKPRS